LVLLSARETMVCIPVDVVVDVVVVVVVVEKTLFIFY
jgi:hypothetical protein